MSAPAVARSTPSQFNPWKSRSVRIKRMDSEAPDVYSYDLSFDDASHANALEFAPGQFSMLYAPGVGEAAISISGHSADRRCLRYTIRSVGAVTRAIETGGVGMSLGLRGPFGSGWPIPTMSDPSNKPDVVISAGGIGLAPLRSLVAHIMEHRDAFGAASVLLGARSPADLLYKDEHSDWKSHGIVVQTTVDRPTTHWNGQVGVVTLLLERLPILRPESTLVMTCGPEVMMRYVAKSAIDRGIPVQNVWVTLERNMNCAIGLCGHCQLGPQIICRDGPVFRYDRVRHWLRVQEL